MKMKRLALAILLFTLASPAWATTYFLAPAASGGNDSNNGTSASTPWLTPNHAVNCGDVILAAAGTYTDTNFAGGLWGTVTCAAGNNVAWLKCATFDTCKITVSGSFNEMDVSASYWGVQGWEVTATSDTNQCFESYPTAGVQLHHIIFANNIANGCYSGGFGAGNNGTAGVDYIAIVGNIAYNGAKSSAECTSGIDIFEPINSDTLPGTHDYIAGNFSWSNVDANRCAGTAPTDGEGVLLDTINGSGDGVPYTGQIVVYNNILLANGSAGFEVYNNNASGTKATIIAQYNTLWGNNNDANLSNGACGEMFINASLDTTLTHNLAMTNAATGCHSSSALYAFMIIDGNGSDTVDNNWGYSAAEHYDNAINSSGFVIGSQNVFGTNPGFTNATTPGAPSCGSATSVPNCMATVISNFTPTVTAAKAYGYQAPSLTSVNDPLFPAWLCNVNLPVGLVTIGCAAQSSLPAPPIITGVKVQ